MQLKTFCGKLWLIKKQLDCVIVGVKHVVNGDLNICFMVSYGYLVIQIHYEAVAKSFVLCYLSVCCLLNFQYLFMLKYISSFHNRQF